MDQSASSDGRETKPSRKRTQENRQVQTELRAMREDGNPDVTDLTDMETRPSWCDAGFALEKIRQKEATGNVCALHIRKVIQRWLYKLGIFVYNWPMVIFIATAGLLGVGISFLFSAKMEMRLEKLWVENDGQLQREIAYMKTIESLGKEADTDENHVPDNAGPSAGGFEIMIQTSISDVRTTDAMLKHSKAAQKAIETEVFMFNRTWKFEDVCYKTPYTPAIYEKNPFTEDILKLFISKTRQREFNFLQVWYHSKSIPIDLVLIISRLLQMIPCLIITPLDCFWDGSKLLGPTPPIGVMGKNYTWLNLNPVEMLEQMFNGQMMKLMRLLLKDVIPPIQKTFEQSGITDGYQSRYCLNPYDEECPTTSPNYEHKLEAPVKQLMANGCTGFATEMMQWPSDIILSSNQPSGALQTIFHIMDSTAVYEKYNGTVPEVEGWSSKKAEDLIRAWSRNFSKQIEKEDDLAQKTEDSTDTRFFSINEVTLLDIIADFSQISFWRIIVGYALMLIYAYLTLRNRAAALSQGGVAMAGVLLIAASVASGLGYTSVMGVHFNAASLQVLPFLLLGLGVDDMFLLACHFQHISLLAHIPIERRTAELLKRVGVSVMLTSISIASAFFCSLIIPMPALQAFGIQAGVVTIFNLAVVLVAFPALLSLDLRRRNSNRVDLFCCLKRSSPASSFFLHHTKQGSSQEVVKGSASKTPTTNKKRRDELVDTHKTYSVVNYIVMTPPESPVERVVEANIETAKSDDLIACKRIRPFGHYKGFTNNIWKCSMHDLATRYYGPFLLRPAVQVIVLLISAAWLGFAAHQASLIRDGLDLADVIPSGTRQNDALTSQQKYFSFYQITIMTKDFDYAKQQRTLTSLHDDVRSSQYVINQTDGSPQKIWPDYFREWLQKMQNKFDDGWEKGYVSDGSFTAQASADFVVAYKMMVQTGNSSNPIQTSRVGCVDDTKPCPKVDKVRFVDDNGLIREDGFYHYLTAWANQDPVGYAVSRSNFKPVPPVWNLADDLPAAPRLLHAEMPYFVNGLRENEDFVKLIKHIRAACDSREDGDFSSFPSGYPFLFWQQYIDLRKWLFVAVGAVLGTIFVVLSLFLVNPYTAAIMILVLVIILVELLGFMGMEEVKLSAMPAVTIVAALGIGLEFIVHLVIAFVTTCGTRNYRVIQSLRHTTAPVVDGAISTLLGVIMLAWARFDFIIKYFFEVLVVLLVLGTYNGLVLLPVLLNLIGPSSEIKFIKKENNENNENNVSNTTFRNKNRNQMVVELSR